SDRRERHPERLRDLWAREAQLTQQQDQLLPLQRRLRGHRPGPRGTILQATLPLTPVAVDPLPGRPLADPGGTGRRRQRPTQHKHPIHQQPPRLRTRPSVAMQYRPPTSLESLIAFATTSLQGRSDEQRSWDLQLIWSEVCQVARLGGPRVR